MSQVEQMAGFVDGARFEALGWDTREQLKIRILDSLGCSLGALHAEPIRMIRSYITELGSCESGSINERAGCGNCTLVGGGCANIDRRRLLQRCTDTLPRFQ